MTANDIMIDLETLDKTASAAILSIGAVRCDLITGEVDDEFYRVVELKNQGRSINSETLYWWLQQSDSARNSLVIPGKILHTELCESFTKWLTYKGDNPNNFRLWGNGASFDNAIIRDFYQQQDQEFPIPFWKDRDMRTLVGFYPTQLQRDWRLKNQRIGTYHNALDDVKYQVKYCSNILQELGVTELY